MTTCEPEVLLSLAQLFARIIMMSFVSVGAILCIKWGWQLYREGIVSRTSGELQNQNIRFKFTAAGPGVILVAFGAWLLSLVATHSFSIETSGLATTATVLPTKTSASEFMLKSVIHYAQASNSNKDSSSTPTIPPQSTVKCEKCLLRHFVIRNMDGRVQEPTVSDIVGALDISIRNMRVNTPIPGALDSQNSNTLRTLSYLREAAVQELPQSSPNSTVAPTK